MTPTDEAAPPDPPARRRCNVLCVCGLTPQVVTETVACLIGSGAPPPESIRIITTAMGARAVRTRLLAPNDGQLARLFSAYRVDPTPQFGEDLLHVFDDGAPLEDILTRDDNIVVADQVNALVRELTSEGMPPLHVSLAGGRKTMGFYAGYALSLHGRPEDELSHVLVSPDRERDPDFFFPDPDSFRRGEEATGSLLLARLPFVRMRNGLSGDWVRGERSFAETVEAVQLRLEPPSLVIDIGQRCARMSGRTVSLSPTHFLWLLWLARRILDGRGPAGFDIEAVEELAACQESLEGAGPSPVHDKLESLRRELDESGKSNYFDRTRSRFNKVLRESKSLPPGVAERYEIRAFGARLQKRYGLKLTAEQIRIVEDM